MPMSWLRYLNRLAKDVPTPLPGTNHEVKCFKGQLKRQGPDGVTLGQAGMIGFITLQQSAPSQMTCLGHLVQQAQPAIKKYLEKQIVINNEGHKHAACREDTATLWAVAKGLEGEVGSIASAAGYAHLLNAHQRNAVIPKKSLGTYLNTLIISVSGIPDGAPARQIRARGTSRACGTSSRRMLTQVARQSKKWQRPCLSPATRQSPRGESMPSFSERMTFCTQWPLARLWTDSVTSWRTMRECTRDFCNYVRPFVAAVGAVLLRKF